MNQLQAEMKRIRELLPTELFEDSKDWREGNTVERIEWLLSMYKCSQQEVKRLEEDIDYLQHDIEVEPYYWSDVSE